MSLLILKLLLNSLIINTPNYISFKILINKVFLSFFILFVSVYYIVKKTKI